MRILTLKEPFATLIYNKVKTIETRSWRTNYRGELYIHAGIKKPEYGNKCEEFIKLADKYSYRPGYVLCKCNLVDCIEMSTEFKEILLKENKDIYTDSSFKENYGWKLENVEVFDKQIETKGKLGLWEYKE